MKRRAAIFLQRSDEASVFLSDGDTSVDNRDLKIYDNDVDENVTAKENFALVKVFRDYSISFTSHNVGEVS